MPRFMSYLPIFVLKNTYETGSDRFRPVVNWLRSEPVRTGFVTGKDRKRLVYTGPVRVFGSLGTLRTGLGLSLRHLRQKTETGLDFQTLSLMTIIVWVTLIVGWILLRSHDLIDVVGCPVS